MFIKNVETIEIIFKNISYERIYLMKMQKIGK